MKKIVIFTCLLTLFGCSTTIVNIDTVNSIDVVESSMELRNEGSREDEDLVLLRELGLRAGDVIAYLNNSNLSSLDLKSDIEESELFSKARLEGWGINSKIEFRDALRERLYTGIRERYNRALENINRRGDINHSLEELSKRDNWVREIDSGDITEKEYFDVAFLAKNPGIITYRSIELFELERFSTFIKWGYNTKYLSREEAEALSEDLAIKMLSYESNWEEFGEAYCSGISFLFNSSQNLGLILFSRSLGVLDVRDNHTWSETDWTSYHRAYNNLKIKGVIAEPKYIFKSIPKLKPAKGINQDLNIFFDQTASNLPITDIYAANYDLFKAITDNDYDRVLYILENEKVYDVQVHTGVSYVSLSVGMDPRIMTLLLEKGFDPGLQNTGNMANALHFAASEDNLEYLRELLKYDVNINIQDKYSTTPIGYAARAKRAENVREMLKAGADPDIGYIGDFNVLGYVIRFLDEDIALEVIEKSALHDRYSYFDWYPIHFAVRNSTPAVVNALVEKGVRIDVQDDKGFNPLHLAVLVGEDSFREKVRNLVNKKNLNAKNIDGYTPVSLYLKYEYIREYEKNNKDMDVFGVVKDYAKDLDILISGDYSPDLKELGLVVWYLRSYATEQQINEALDMGDIYVNRLFYDISKMLILRDFKDTYYSLIDKYSDQINTVFNNDNNLLYQTGLIEGSSWAIEYLLSKGADINMKGPKGALFPVLLAEEGRYRDLLMVLDYDVNLDLIDSRFKKSQRDVLNKLMDIDNADAKAVMEKINSLGL